jgi:hypothetical protein
MIREILYEKFQNTFIRIKNSASSPVPHIKTSLLSKEVLGRDSIRRPPSSEATTAK